VDHCAKSASERGFRAFLSSLEGNLLDSISKLGLAPPAGPSIFMAFQITNARLEEYAKFCGCEVKPGTLRIFGLKGAAPYGNDPSGLSVRLVKNELDQWNDCIGVWGTELELFLATVDPGLEYTEAPMNANGAAHLLTIEEIHKSWRMVKAVHKHEYGCLGQGEPFTVRRDKNRDGDAESGEPLDTGYFAIQIHAGGVGSKVGAWSAACSVLFGGRSAASPWQKFWNLILASGQTEFEYFLIDAAKFAEFLRV
jgi:hypothetical protein